MENVTINFDGSFSFSGLSLGSAAGAAISISGMIGNGAVTGLAGSAALNGSQDTGTSLAGLAGFYSAAGLLGASGNLYAVVAGDGQTLVVVSGGSTDATGES